MYLRYFKNAGVNLCILLALLIVGHQSAAILANAWLSKWSAHPNANSSYIKFFYLGVFCGFGVVDSKCQREEKNPQFPIVDVILNNFVNFHLL